MKSGKQNIVWVASYPKSGNTWFRIFLNNLYSKTISPININDLSITPIASGRLLFDISLGVNTSDLSSEEINILRPAVYRYISENNNNTIYFKVHDAWDKNVKGEPLFPLDVTQSVIYIIRNPLDIVVSLSYHNANSFDETISHINSNDYAFCSNPFKLHKQLYQKLYSWSSHVLSWVDNSNLPILVIRYEDMINKTYETFSKTIRFLKLDFTKKDIITAIENSDFLNIKNQEIKHGFKEKPQNSPSFFRSGKAETWKDYLNHSQIRSIIKNQETVMRRFGY